MWVDVVLLLIFVSNWFIFSALATILYWLIKTDRVTYDEIRYRRLHGDGVNKGMGLDLNTGKIYVTNRVCDVDVQRFLQAAPWWLHVLTYALSLFLFWFAARL